LSELVAVIDSRGRTLTPCRRKVAEREVRLHRAKWLGSDKIRLHFDPFAYRYVRLKVLDRDGHLCYWCGQPGATIDHVIPWSKGGFTTMDNCICACEECNGARGNLHAVEYARRRNVAPPVIRSTLPGPKPSFLPGPKAPSLLPPPVPMVSGANALYAMLDPHNYRVNQRLFH
jgi:hypothetical protein